MAKEKVYSTGDDQLWNDLARLEKKYGIKSESEAADKKERDAANKKLREYVNK